MKTIEDVIIRYLPLKKSGELSLKEIRLELENSEDFSDEDISSICKQISDAELTEISKPKKPLLDFFKHIGFAYFNTILMVGIIAYCIYFLSWVYGQDPSVEVPINLKVYPSIFMGGAIIFFTRNYMRIKRYRRNN